MVGFVDVDRLCELREASASVVLDADVDVWLGDTWVTRFGYGPDKPAFWSVGCSALVARIRAYLAEAHSGDRLGASVNDARLTIHSATLSVGTLGLAQLSDQPDVLLFDPEEDLLAPWARLAAQVRLVAPIDAFAESIRAKVAAGDILEPFVPGALSKPKGDQR